MLSSEAMAADSVHEYKMRFAELLQRVPIDKRLAGATIVAKQVVGKDADRYPMYVIKIAEEWPFDSEVIAELDRLDLIPIPKEVILKKVYGEATDRFSEAKDRIQALRLYSEMNGWTRTTKDSGNTPNELLSHLQALHNAVANPTDT